MAGWRDADTGRFTALDPLGARGGDTDWYGYCVDDPVNRVDAWGLATFNVGANVSGIAFGVGGMAGVSVGRDGEGAWSFQKTVGAGPAAGYGVSGGLFGQYTNATRMEDLEGNGVQAGGSFGDLPVGTFKIGRTYGADKVMGDGYDGVSAQVGIGAGTPETHAYGTKTSSIKFPNLDMLWRTHVDDDELFTY